MKKFIGRLVHFVLFFGITLGVLNAFYYQKVEILGAISTTLIISLTYIGLLWEYYLQEIIAKKFSFLKWESEPDDVAWWCFVFGSLFGIIAFYTFYLLKIYKII